MWLNVGSEAQRWGIEAEILQASPTWSQCKCAGCSCGFRKELGEATLEIVTYPEDLTIHQMCIAWQSPELAYTNEGDRVFVLKRNVYSRRK